MADMADSKTGGFLYSTRRFTSTKAFHPGTEDGDDDDDDGDDDDGDDAGSLTAPDSAKTAAAAA